MSTWEQEEKLLKAYNERIESGTYSYKVERVLPKPLDFVKIDLNNWKFPQNTKVDFIPSEPPKCDCGGAIARTTHSDWCSYENWTNNKKA